MREKIRASELLRVMRLSVGSQLPVNLVEDVCVCVCEGGGGGGGMQLIFRALDRLHAEH